MGASEAARPYRLGVDLGTTWTAAVVDDGDNARPLPLGDQGPAIASVVARAGETFVFGSAAERQILTAPASGVREVKRRVGDAAPIIVAGVPYGADALLGALLAHVVERATDEMGGAPDHVVLTHPAVWGEYKLDVLRAAAQAAGVDDVDLLPEPTAAAMHYATLGKIAPGDTVAVYDFGGGTFDAAVVRHTDDGFEILGTPEGIERLGGIDIDQAVLAHVDASLDGQLREVDREQGEVRQGLARLRDECVRAKEALSTDTETAIPVDVPGLRTSVRLTRAELEAMVRPRLADTVRALDRAVASAGLTNTDITSVLLVGGTSRLPVVAEVIAASTGRPTTLDAHPKLVVALGAALDPQRLTAPADDASDGMTALVAVTASETQDRVPGGTAAGEKRAAPPAVSSAGTEKAGRRGSRLGGGAAVAAAVGVVAGAAAAADAVFGSDSASAATAHPTREPQAPDPHAHPAAVGEAHAAGDPHAPTTTTMSATPRSQAEAQAQALAQERAAMAGSARAHLVGSSQGFAHRGGGEPRMAPRAYAREQGEHAGMPQHEVAHQPDAFEAYREQMMERLASWPGPEGASPDEVAKLRQELGGVIHRAVHEPGQSLDNARAELEDRLDDKLHVYETDQKVDALIQQEQHENEQHIREAGFSEAFGHFQGYIAQGLQSWQPPGWGEGGPNDGAALAAFKAQVSSLLVSTHYDPNKPYAVQEQALRASVAGLAQTFSNDQYQQYVKDHNAELDAQFQATANGDRTDIQPWQIKGELDKITAEKVAFNSTAANHFADKFDAGFLPSAVEGPDDQLRHEFHVFDKFGPPPPPPEQMQTGEQTGDQPTAMSDAIDHTGDGPPTDPLHHQTGFDVTGTQIAAGHETLLAGDGHHVATAASDDDFLGSAAATEHLTRVATEMNADAASPDASTAPANGEAPASAGEPTPPAPAAASTGPDAAPSPTDPQPPDGETGPGDHDDANPVMHHDHEHGVAQTEHENAPMHHDDQAAAPVDVATPLHDATNPFDHDDPAAPPPEPDPPVVPVDEAAPVMANADDDI